MGTVAHNRLKTEQKSKLLSNATRMSDAFDMLDGEVRLFRTTASGDVWQMRLYVTLEKKYIRKSLKTRDKEIACKRAKDEYFDYHSRIRSGQKIFSVSAKELSTEYLKSVNELVTANQISVGRQSNIKTHIKHYVEFVGANSKIQNIDKKFFQGYRQFRQIKRKEITMTVVMNESISIKQMYRWAIDKGYIGAGYELDFGKINIRKDEVRRESFTIKEYEILTNFCSRWHSWDSKESDKEEIYYRRLLGDFIVLMGNFGFRTGELLLLKFSDVLVHEDDTATVIIRAENTKVRKQREIRGRRGDIFLEIKKYSKFADPDDYVFSHFHKRENMGKTLLYDYYEKLIKRIKQKHEDFDDSKTLYSLRHFWITLHLLAGKVDVYKIARYAGTSLLQIQKHYDNVKDSQVSKEILLTKIRFDKNHEIILEQ